MHTNLAVGRDEVCTVPSVPKTSLIFGSECTKASQWGEMFCYDPAVMGLIPS